MEISFVCPQCHNTETIVFGRGVFDTILYDEPRFPGSTVYMCPVCSKVTALGGEGLIIRVRGDRGEVPIKLKTDDYVITFRIRGLDNETREYDISCLEEVIGRFFIDGSLPD